MVLVYIICQSPSIKCATLSIIGTIGSFETSDEIDFTLKSFRSYVAVITQVMIIIELLIDKFL